MARVIDFAGWRGTSPRDVLSPTASMLSTDPAFGADPDGGSDGSSTDFDPESAGFAISVWVKPTRASLFPRGMLKPSAVSLNIVQKGRTNTAGGYWKLSTEMARTKAGLRWAALSAFRSAAGCAQRQRFGARSARHDRPVGRLHRRVRNEPGNRHTDHHP